MNEEMRKEFIEPHDILVDVAARSNVPKSEVYRVIRSLRDVTIDRFNAGQDMLIPGLVRIARLKGRSTDHYIRITQVSKYLKSQLTIED